jgi:hypothetical protein
MQFTFIFYLKIAEDQSAFGSIISKELEKIKNCQPVSIRDIEELIDDLHFKVKHVGQMLDSNDLLEIYC